MLLASAEHAMQLPEPFTWTPERRFEADLRDVARRIFARARRPIHVEIVFVHVGSPEDGRRISTDPVGSSLRREDFDSLRIETSTTDLLRTTFQKRLIECDRRDKARSFSTGPVRVGDVDVFPVIRFDAALVEAQPALSKQGDQVPRCRSLLEGVAWTLLLEATASLRRTDGGEPSYDHLGRDPDDVLRAAGRWLTVTAGHACGHPQGLLGLFDEINEIGSLRYEGREPSGRIVLARRAHPQVRALLRFRRPVPLSDAVWARKMLEIASGAAALLSDSICIDGIGRVSPTYDATREDVFSVEFTGPERWALLHADTILMRVVYGIPMLPEERLSARELRAALRAEFGDLPESALSRIWRVVCGAIAQKGGALIVVSRCADEETKRLASQGAPVEPTALSDELAGRVTAIDGAVMLDTDGVCHAVGVILDGKVRRDLGNPARGARYNSALRYIDAAGGPALAVVVSEDETVDIMRWSRVGCGTPGARGP